MSQIVSVDNVHKRFGDIAVMLVFEGYDAAGKGGCRNRQPT